MIPDHLQRHLEHRNNPITIAQITDSHLEQTDGGGLLGMDTDASLAHVLGLVDEDLPFDLILATGDLANHGSAQAYQRFGRALSAVPAPVFWLAGNHDQLEAMEAVVNGGEPLVRRLIIGSWQIVLLDSTVPGEVGGTLGHDELKLLEECLGDAPDRHTLICMHHHPVPIGCAWLDEQRVSDADRFFSLIDLVPQVKGVLCGHVHQAHELRRGQHRIITSPSTCIQFAPGSEGFAVDELSPGYRRLSLYGDGRIETTVRRVEGVKFEFDRNSNGYL